MSMNTLQIELEFENVGFCGEGKPEYLEKTSRSKAENQQQAQPKYDPESGKRTQVTLMVGEWSHRRTILAPQREC